ncbi:hypothetical protein [Candidatus Fokinia solitaria]|uniref:hypothetical protein n=1 Tax=Candidatus Fokinia solitaria TaxID=1802984 RepID=UPI000D3E9DCD|nr:hypothetical protein [Candidatus Fokinia solitaria]
MIEYLFSDMQQKTRKTWGLEVEAAAMSFKEDVTPQYHKVRCLAKMSRMMDSLMATIQVPKLTEEQKTIQFNKIRVNCNIPKVDDCLATVEIISSAQDFIKEDNHKYSLRA